MENKRQKKKSTKTVSSSDAFDEQDTPEMYQLKQKNQFLKQKIRTQTNQIGQLYIEINNLQEKEEEHQERIQAFDKLDRYVKRMTKNNQKAKTLW